MYTGRNYEVQNNGFGTKQMLIILKHFSLLLYKLSYSRTLLLINESSEINSITESKKTTEPDLLVYDRLQTVRQILKDSSWLKNVLGHLMMIG
jgi:hypothetical protein